MHDAHHVKAYMISMANQCQPSGRAIKAPEDGLNWHRQRCCAWGGRGWCDANVNGQDVIRECWPALQLDLSCLQQHDVSESLAGGVLWQMQSHRLSCPCMNHRYEVPGDAWHPGHLQAKCSTRQITEVGDLSLEEKLQQLTYEGPAHAMTLHVFAGHGPNCEGHVTYRATPLLLPSHM